MLIEMRKTLKGMGWFWYLMAFLFVGPTLMNAIKTFRAKLDSVALINGLPIRHKDFARIKSGHENYIRQLQNMGLGQFAQRMSDMDLVKIAAQNVLEQGVADRLGIIVGGEELASEVANGVAKSAISKEGRVDMAQYSLSLAANAGMTIVEYEDTLLKKMRADALGALVKSCAYEPLFFGNYLSKIKKAKKRFQIIEIPFEKIEDSIKKTGVSSEELDLFYQENAKDYMTAAKKEVLYAVLDRKLFKDAGAPDEAELEEFYEKAKDTKFADPEKYSVSYTWIEFATEEEAVAARAKLEALRQEIVSSEKSLARLAKKQGLDAESKQMILLSRNELPEVVEQALEAKINAVTAVVEDEKKVYLAQVDKFKPFVVKAYEDVKAEVATDVQKIKVDQLIREDIEEIMTEARESDNGEEVFCAYADKMQLAKKNLSLRQDEAPSEELASSIFKHAFDQHAEAGYLGYVLRGDEIVLFFVKDTVNPEVRPFVEVASEVKKACIEHQAKVAQEHYIFRLKEKMLENSSLDEELGRYKLKAKISDWLTEDKKELAGYDFGPKFLEQLKTTDRAELILKHRSGETVYLLRLDAIELQSPDEEQKNTGSVATQNFTAKQDIFDGFVATLLKNATLEPNKRTIQDLIPEF